MIEIKVKIHDKFSVEFKVGFVARRKLRENHFAMNTWIFVPNSLDINSFTYPKKEFYRDVKSNIRLITPIFLLRDIAAGAATPLHHITSAFNAMASDPTRTNIAEYEYQIKMFTAIIKSSLRNEILHIIDNSTASDIDYLGKAYIESIRTICTRYRELWHIINVPIVPNDVKNYFLFGDEFISNLIERNTTRLINRLGTISKDTHKKLIDDLIVLVTDEVSYKRGRGYAVAEIESPDNNRALIFRHGVLKKYVESDLFLNAKKKKDAAWVEQIYYSIAAGLAMVFATAVAFSFQKTYGNFTMPLFVALVISYMLKDRIKDLMRYFFAYRLRGKYFDNKTTISIKDHVIGWSKEGVDFITDSKVPRRVMEIRSRSPLLEAENRISDEKIILYRKMVQIDRSVLDENNQYTIAGVNDIIRLYVNSFVQKMDNPQVPLYVMDDAGDSVVVNGDKVYYLNLVMQFQYEDQLDYKRYRIVLTRAGILGIDELK